MTHPSRKLLEALADNDLSASGGGNEVRAHLEVCEFCRDYIEDYRAHGKVIGELLAAPLSGQITIFLDRLSREDRRGLVIELTALPTANVAPQNYLAADSPTPSLADSLSIATLYSENPEIVLRMMRDQGDDSRYLQLIAESIDLTANVLVCAPEIGAEIATDSGGRATLPASVTGNPAHLKWQIRLPEASFDLQPLVYSPDKIEYSRDTILESDRGDRIKVTLTTKTVGKQIEIELLQLDGQEDFEKVKILLIEDRHLELQSLDSGQRVLFTLPEHTSNINLRIFQ